MPFFFSNMQELFVFILMLPTIVVRKTEMHEVLHQFIWLFEGHHAVTHRSGGSRVVMHFFGHQVLVFNLPKRGQSWKRF